MQGDEGVAVTGLKRRGRRFYRSSNYAKLNPQWLTRALQRSAEPQSSRLGVVPCYGQIMHEASRRFARN